MTYHSTLGVSQFYILYDGHDKAALEHLIGVKQGVHLILLSERFGSEQERQGYQEYLRTDASTFQWQGRPGNFDLMIRQCE